MSEDKPLVNRVAASGLITLRLESFFPDVALAEINLKDYLFQELLLREKDFREAMQAHNWSQYEGKVLLVFCSTDAIIPVWAFMLVAAYAAPYAKDIFQGTREDYYRQVYRRIIDEIDVRQYAGERIVIKGCSDKPVPLSAYLDLTARLQPHARSIMFGEPCSTVPIYKQPKKVQRPEK